MDTESTNKLEQSNKRSRNRISTIVLVFGILFVVLRFVLSAPMNNKDATIHVISGQSVSSVAIDLKDQNIIKSTFIFKIFVKLLESGNGVIPGDYLIYKKTPVWIVAWQVGRGHHNIQPVKVTFIEGSTNEQIAKLLADKLSGFRKDLFLSEVKDKQGYLFPDTYFFYPFDQTDEIIKKFSNNFNIQTRDIRLSAYIKGKEFSDIIKMASILQGEAGGEDDIRIISGILWKRIEKGMPLQVDVAKSTYKNKGFPQQPLNNPGTLAIDASLNPQESSYLYYIHDKKGEVHFAITLKEHNNNINKYLK